MIMVNGNTWPFQIVEQRRYRFRFLDGCQSRFLILDFSQIPGVEVWQIGNEGGFLAAPVNITADYSNRLLMGLAERADVIVDFTNVPVGSYILGNLGPDEPFGGGEPGVDFEPSDPNTTGQILQFQVVPAVAPDPTTPPQFLLLPAIAPFPVENTTRPWRSRNDVEYTMGRSQLGTVLQRQSGTMWMSGHRESERGRHRSLGVL
jgi:FtsP/CotA-like multicopper oxidase with cupredoxin domain